ncbi:hypothetical protein DFO55_12437 [Grimontella sp. AG753]|nr:hypothetical protein DFO55_12437 [Grimontella sp. AG753]
MRKIILNKLLAIPALFFILLCYKGGEVAAWVMANTNLSAWLETNKLNNTFSGADFSFLPAIAVMSIILFTSVSIHFLIETVFEIIDSFTIPPDTNSEKVKINKTTESADTTSATQKTNNSLASDEINKQENEE